jgi:plasmid stability protein
MANLQVKGLEDELYRSLGARAARDNRSISQEVVVIIKEYLSREHIYGRAASRSILALAGSWSDDRPAQEIAAELRAARRNKSRNRRLDDVFARH